MENSTCDTMGNWGHLALHLKGKNTYLQHHKHVYVTCKQIHITDKLQVPTTANKSDKKSNKIQRQYKIACGWWINIKTCETCTNI